jgi:DNA mismatch endonuclease (patch repair protein)
MSDRDRRRIMQSIRKTNTRPELSVRSALHRMGYRFRLHRQDLPGVPDIVLPRLRTVVLVHGCFWHQHDCKLGRKQPKSNQDYWLPKLRRNMERDVSNAAALREAGWSVVVVWECETAAEVRLGSLLAERLPC